MASRCRRGCRGLGCDHVGYRDQIFGSEGVKAQFVGNVTCAETELNKAGQEQWRGDERPGAAVSKK